ncbi:MAG: hypothetical protein IID44_24410 [Planctomycetes bacterium]|nr:hypothetical protein [Planctomycetota bacterium]
MNVTPEQLQSIQQGQAVSVTVGQTECVVVRLDVFRRIQQHAYDDSDWSDDEMSTLAAQMFEGLDDPQKIQ